MPHFVGKSETTKEDKDIWQTPKYIFDALDNEFHFYIDACASEENALCFHYFTEENSALDNEWIAGNVFINPPYSQTALFLERAAQQARKRGCTVVALVNANTDTKWFAEAVATANEVRLITGRISFVKPDGTSCKGQNTKGQCLIIWRGICNTPCQITMIDRNFK